MTYTDSGSLKIRAYSASGAIPTEGVLIKIYGADDYNKDVQYSLITDSDGITKELYLPTPPLSYSMSPGAAEAPYSVYNVELAKNGFYPKRIDNVPIFAGIKSTLPIEMIPLAYSEDGYTLPQENLNSVIYENEHLQ